MAGEQNILIGPGKIRVAALATAMPSETSVEFGADWPAGWDGLGLLMQGQGVRIRDEETLKAVMVEEYTAPVKHVITGKNVALAATLSEWTPANMALVSGENTATAAGAAQKPFNTVEWTAATQDKVERTVAVEAFRLDDAGVKQPVRFQIYCCVMQRDGETPVQQQNESVMPVLFMAQADVENDGRLARLEYVTGPTT